MKRLTRHRDIESLETAAAWPGADRATLVTLAARYVAAGMDADGHRYFERLARASGQLTPRALAAFLAVRAGADVGAALAALDEAAAADLGLPQYLRGMALASLPLHGDPERAAQAVADLEFVLAVRDQFPPLLIRGVHSGLAAAYQALGQEDKARDYAERSGVPAGGHRLLFGTDWGNAADGFRMTAPALVSPAPGVLVARGYDFADFAFITTSDGVIAIDAGTAPHRVRAALADAALSGPVTHVILTHGHFDHVGGIGALAGPGTTVIAQAGFPAEQERQRGNHLPFRNFTGETGGGGKPVIPGQLITEPTALTVGGTELMLYPTAGGETADALMVYLPASGLLFTGDVMMPYLGAPFFAEGSAEGLLETIGFIRELAPRALIAGHPPLTEVFTVHTLAGLQAALGALREHVLDGIGRGLALAEILDGAYLPPELRDHPLAVLPYLVTRDNFAARLYHQRTGYWGADGRGLAPLPAAARAAALDLLGGGGEEPFARAAGALVAQGDHALALELIEPGLARYPASAALARLRQDALRGLAELHQQLDPFRFIVYAELAGLELGPVR